MKFKKFIEILALTGCFILLTFASYCLIKLNTNNIKERNEKYEQTKYIIEIGNMITGKDSYWVKEYKQDGDVISFTDVYGKSYSIKTNEFVVKKKDN